MYKEFINKGFVKKSITDKSKFYNFISSLSQFSTEFSQKKITDISSIHNHLAYEKINDFRVNAIQHINNKTDIKNILLNECKTFLIEALGPDLVVQKNLNLVLNFPDDHTSTIPLHTDTLTGHSLFEITVLLPLTEVNDDDCMFIMDIETFKKNKNIFTIPNKMSETESLQHHYKNNKQNYHLLNLKPGDIMFFWHHLPHGDYVNHSKHTHWSLNLRFKHLFSPYGEKRFGDYFVPWISSAFTELALNETSL